MIFVTVGTHHQPFQRLLDALKALDGDDLVVQYGSGEVPPGISRAEAYIPFDAMLECFRQADKVITHAGVGSILCARREGHVPLVVPRRHDLGEHVDEHQAELANMLEAEGSVIAALDVGELTSLLDTVPSRHPKAQSDRSELADAVHHALVAPNS